MCLQAQSNSHWSLAPSNDAAGSVPIIQQQSPPAPTASHPQAAADSAAGSQHTKVAANGSKGAAQTLSVQHPDSVHSHAESPAHGSQHVPHRISPTEVERDANPANGSITEKPPKEPTATAAQHAKSEELAACSAQLSAFGVMCGTSNQHKLEDFLQSIFEYQEVGFSCSGVPHSGCYSKIDLQSKTASSTVLVSLQHSMYGFGTGFGQSEQHPLLFACSCAAWYDTTIVGACPSDGISTVNKYNNLRWVAAGQAPLLW